MSASATPRSMPGVVNFAKDPFSVELREVAVPSIGNSDVLLRVGAVSVCGSDVHQWRGSHSWPVNYPCILGHEFSGTVAATGADVKGFREGDRVVSETAAVIDEATALLDEGELVIVIGQGGRERAAATAASDDQDARHRLVVGRAGWPAA